MKNPVRILGIDPGLRLTGYGVIDWQPANPARPKLVDGGVIRLSTRASLADRLVELERELETIFVEHHPAYCAVEELYSHYAHPRTAILMGHARGVILLVANRHRAVICELAANRIKQSLTGHGHAPKQTITRAVQSLWRLPKPPHPPDVADALAIALCCGNSLNNTARPRPKR